MKRTPVLLVLALWAVALRAEESLLVEKPSSADFVLAANGAAPAILVDAGANVAVQRVAGDLAADIERVTGVKPVVATELPAGANEVVCIGVLGQSVRIDGLVAAGKLDASTMRGAWEARVVQVVEAPWPGVKRALVIAGSDRRGAAYGVYDVSEAIGVSPWYWWADVPVTKRASLAIRAGVHAHGAPAVKFRGIFINDEDWGLQPWAAKTFEPEVGDIGPKTYAKVCELLLRLRANYLWPAMHPSTRAFNHYPDNKRVADEYGIFMGSSHAEPMLRNNVDEWPHDRAADYNYVTNRDGVLKYWEDRVQENAKYDNVFTMGMRGIHDSTMLGGGTLDEKALRLTKIIADQRAMLAKWVNPDPAKVPQIYCPYKEALELYRRLPTELPGDITLCWPDDNWGYVRQFSDAHEQQRPGGAGVYYHISYWGAPYDYLWLCSTPPALVWEEMAKAYDHGANTVWVVNVGDIKPAERPMEFFLKLAWAPHAAQPETVQHDFLRDVAARDFGAEHADEIASLMDDYYRMSFPRKPEHMGLDPKKPLVAKPVYSPTANGNEAKRRMNEWDTLERRAAALANKLPETSRSSFEQLVHYPIGGAALANERGDLLAQYVSAKATENEVLANDTLSLARLAHRTIQAETQTYNERLSDGKWRGIMSPAPRDLAVFKFPDDAALAALVASAKTNDTAAAVPPAPAEPGARIVLEAEHAVTKTMAGAAAWRTIVGLGYNGSSTTVWPTTWTIASTEPAELRSRAPRLDFTVNLDRAGAWTFTARTLPNWPLVAGKPARYAIALDEGDPQIITLPKYTEENNPTWQEDVLRNASLTSTPLAVATSGTHTLHVWSLDAGVVFDTFMLARPDAAPAGYLWPEATVVKK